MRTLPLPNGNAIPVLGLGTWHMGESTSRRSAEITAVRTAIELGYRLIDTAEMYGDGGAESVVGLALLDAIRAGDVKREDMLIVSKVLPHNASRTGTQAACDRSRKRLGQDHIDVYLLHWRGSHPLGETVKAIHTLMDAGAIRDWGVSNFDTADMRELASIEANAGGSPCATNQVYYSLSERGPEFSLLPWMRERAMPLMAYSPIDQGSLAKDSRLAALGKARGLTAAQLALAWVMQQPGVVAIPKALSHQHLKENLAAVDIELSDAELQQINAHFPGPQRETPLAMI